MPTMIEEMIPTWTRGSMEEIAKEKCTERGHPWITIEIDLKESATQEMKGVNLLFMDFFICLILLFVVLIHTGPFFFFRPPPGPPRPAYRDRERDVREHPSRSSRDRELYNRPGYERSSYERSLERYDHGASSFASEFRTICLLAVKAGSELGNRDKLFVFR